MENTIFNYKNYEISKKSFVETIVNGDDIEHQDSYYYEIEDKFYGDVIAYDSKDESAGELWSRRQRLETGFVSLELAKKQIDELIK